MNTLEVSIDDNHSSRIGERVFQFTPEEAKGGTMGPTARVLVQEGFDTETTVRVLTFGVPAFTTELTLGTWADDVHPGQRGLKVHPLLLAKLGL